MKFGRNVPLLNSHRLTESDFRYDVISRRLVLQRYVTTYLVLAVVFCWNDLFKKPMGDTHTQELKKPVRETCTIKARRQKGSPDHGCGTVCPLNCDSKTFASPSLGGYLRHFCFAETRRIVTSLC